MRKWTEVVFIVVIVVWAVGGPRINHKNSGEVKGTNTAVATVTVSPSDFDIRVKAFGLKIDKLSILAPITKNVDGNDKTAYNKALKDGLAHYKKTSLPGEKGNIFIFGHSSAEFSSDYSKIFAKLNDLEKNDEITVFYEGKELKYKVKENKIVEATDVSVLDKTKTEVLTLMTCWPIGTKEKRLIIRAEPS